MRREQLDHVLRAAAGVLGVDELLVVGSQAIHASLAGDLFDAAQRSVEVDVVPFDDADGAQADLIDGSIGEASMFHEAFGVYAQGVAETTAILPEGWRDRLLRYEERRGRVVAWCLDPNDLWVSKAVAGRPKDREFCDALLQRDLVDPDVIRDRLRTLDPGRVSDAQRARAEGWLERSSGA